MLASHLNVPVEWRTTSRLLWHYNDGPSSSRQLCFQECSSAVLRRCLFPLPSSAYRRAHKCLYQPPCSARYSLFQQRSDTVPCTCLPPSSAGHSLVLQCSVCRVWHNDGPTSVSAYLSAVLAIRSSSSAAAPRRAHWKAHK